MHSSVVQEASSPPNAGDAADAIHEALGAVCQELGGLESILLRLRHLEDVVEQFNRNFPLGASEKWANMEQREREAQEALLFARGELETERRQTEENRAKVLRVLQQTGTSNATIGAISPNAPLDEVVALQQAALAAAVQDRERALVDMRECDVDYHRLLAECEATHEALNDKNRQLQGLRVQLQRMTTLFEA